MGTPAWRAIFGYRKKSGLRVSSASLSGLCRSRFSTSTSPSPGYRGAVEICRRVGWAVEVWRPLDSSVAWRRQSQFQEFQGGDSKLFHKSLLQVVGYQ